MLPVYHVDRGVRKHAWQVLKVASMRRFLIGLVLVLLLVASIGVGVTVARWPALKLSWHDGRLSQSCSASNLGNCSRQVDHVWLWAGPHKLNRDGTFLEPSAWASRCDCSGVS